MLVQAPEQITPGYLLRGSHGTVGPGLRERVHESLDAGCGSTGEQLDTELEKILYETELHTIDYLRQFTIIDFMGRIEFDLGIRGRFTLFGKQRLVKSVFPVYNVLI